MIVTEPRTRTLNGTAQAGPDRPLAIRDYVRAYERRHGRGKTAEDLGVSRHTLWRFLERGHTGRIVPSAVLNAVGGNIAALGNGVRRRAGQRFLVARVVGEGHPQADDLALV